MTKVTGTRFRDDRIQDALTLFKRELRESITENSSSKYGSAVFRINTSDSGQGALGLAFLSGLTLITPNLVGMPFANYRTVLDVRLDIINSSGENISSYSAVGESKVWVKVGGYNMGDAKRVSNIRALKTALGKIKEDIEKDSGDIREKLLRTSSPE
jgi:hypothetical protein